MNYRSIMYICIIFIFLMLGFFFYNISYGDYDYSRYTYNIDPASVDYLISLSMQEREKIDNDDGNSEESQPFRNKQKNRRGGRRRRAQRRTGSRDAKTEERFRLKRIIRYRFRGTQRIKVNPFKGMLLSRNRDNSPIYNPVQYND